mgnify:CR=1 FL=1
MKNLILHHLFCLLPLVVLLIGIDRGWIRNGAICMLWIFVYAFIWVPILDYRRLKISKIIDTTDLRFLQKINYAYSCRFKYPKHFFMG